MTDAVTDAAARPAASGGGLRGALAWAGLGQAAFFVLQLGGSVLLARLLAPREIGVFAVGAAAVALVSSLGALGLNNLLVRAERPDRDLLATVFTINLGLALGVGAIVAALALAGARLFDDPGTIDVMLRLAAAPGITALGLVPASLLQRENDFRALTLLKVAGALAGTALSAALALAGRGATSLADGWLITCAVNALGACALAPRHVPRALGLRAWRQVAAFGSGMLVSNGVTQAQRQVLNLVLGRVQGLEAVGLFSRANNLVALLLDNTQASAARVLLADFAGAARRGGDLRARYRAVVATMTALLWPPFAGLAVLAPPVVRGLYGPAWDGLAPPLALLAVAGLFWIAAAMAWELFVLAGETGRQAGLEIRRVGVGSLLFLAGCALGLVPAAATRILEAAYALHLYRPHITAITGCTGRDLRSVYARSGLLTLAAVAPSAGLMLAQRWSPEVPPAQVAASVALGVVLWWAALARMRHPLAAEIAALVRCARR